MSTTTQVLKSKEYETIYVLRGDVDPDTAERVQNRVTEVVSRESGKMVKVESWGRRKLAYPVSKSKKGVYVYVKYVGKGGLVQELERNLKLQDSVLKFQTVMLQEDFDTASLTVDPEDLKYTRLELPTEEEKEESRERQLGLIDFGGDAPKSREPREDEFADEDEAAVPESTSEKEKAKEEAPAATGGGEET
jgi:small subunit ribosomal protein S6